MAVAVLLGAVALAGCATVRVSAGATSDFENHVGAEVMGAVTWLVDAETGGSVFVGPTMSFGGGAAHDGSGGEGIVAPGFDLFLPPDDSIVALRYSFRLSTYLTDGELRAAGIGWEAGLPIVVAGSDFGDSGDDIRALLGPYVGAHLAFRGSDTQREEVGFARGAVGIAIEAFGTDDP